MKTWPAPFVRIRTKITHAALSLLVASGALAGTVLPAFAPQAASADQVCVPVHNPGNGSAAALNITAPAEAEAWAPGSTHDITWTACNTGPVDITYGYTDSDSQWHTITGIGNDVPSDNGENSFAWHVPGHTLPTPAAQIRIRQVSGTVAAMSDDFTVGVAGPTITTNVPPGSYSVPMEAHFFADDGVGPYESLPMHYTTDGTNPTPDSLLYTGPILVKSNTSVKLLATDSLGNSTIATFTYVVFPLTAPQPIIDLHGTGAVATPGTTLQWQEGSETGPDIMYQVQLLKESQDFDGIDPAPITANGLSYATGDLTDGMWYWRVRACDTGCTRLSGWSNMQWFIIDTQSPDDPTASVGSGTYNTPLRVSFLDTSPDILRIDLTIFVSGKIHRSPCTYSGATGCTIGVYSSETIKVAAIDMAGRTSQSVTYTYVIDMASPNIPAATLLPGTYAGPQTLTLSAADNAGGSGLAGIYYTADGSTPDKTNGTAYTGPILVGSSSVIKAIAYDAAGNMSEVATFAYDITFPLAPLAGTSGGTGSDPSSTAPTLGSTPTNIVAPASGISSLTYPGSGNRTASTVATTQSSAADTVMPSSGVKGAKTGGPANLDKPKPAAQNSRSFTVYSWWWLAIVAAIVVLYLTYAYNRKSKNSRV